jgi:transposase-like protein
MNTMTAMNSSSSRTGRRYDREFKNNAVALGSGRTVTDVAHDLGVSKWSLGRWVEQAGVRKQYSSETQSSLRLIVLLRPR